MFQHIAVGFYKKLVRNIHFLSDIALRHIRKTQKLGHGDHELWSNNMLSKLCGMSTTKTNSKVFIKQT